MENKMEENKENLITMETDTGETVDFYVLEETRVSGKNYLLVTDAEEDEDGTCYLLKDMSGENDAEASYEFVEEDGEFDAVMRIFEELLSDADVEFEK